jgi:hypothetical protein
MMSNNCVAELYIPLSDFLYKGRYYLTWWPKVTLMYDLFGGATSRQLNPSYTIAVDFLSNQVLR